MFGEDTIGFWWGWMPGETAYCWIFSDQTPIARVGFTRPLSPDLDTLPDPGRYHLLELTDDSIPRGNEYIRRFLILPAVPTATSSGQHPVVHPGYCRISRGNIHGRTAGSMSARFDDAHDVDAV